MITYEDAKPDFLETTAGENWLDSAATGLEFKPTPEFAFEVAAYFFTKTAWDDLGFLLIHINNGNINSALTTLREVMDKNAIHDLAREHMMPYAEDARRELEEQNKDDQAEYERWKNE